MFHYFYSPTSTNNKTGDTEDWDWAGYDDQTYPNWTTGNKTAAAENKSGGVDEDQNLIVQCLIVTLQNDISSYSGGGGGGGTRPDGGGDNFGTATKTPALTTKKTPPFQCYSRWSEHSHLILVAKVWLDGVGIIVIGKSTFDPAVHSCRWNINAAHRITGSTEAELFFGAPCNAIARPFSFTK